MTIIAENTCPPGASGELGGAGRPPRRSRPLAAHALLLALLAVAGLGCGPDDSLGPGQLPSANEATEPGGAMSRALRASYIEMRQARADERYAFAPVGTGMDAFNHAHGMRVHIAGSTVDITGVAGSAFTMALTGIGRGGATGEAPEVAELRREHNRVWLRRGDLEEWYVNGPLGLEQGWTIRERPAGSGVLTLVVTFAGVTPREADGHVELYDEDGEVVARYTDLFVSDADGVERRAWMDVRGPSVELRIDDREARYPLTIDPLVTDDQKVFAADAPVASAGFATSLSISGDTAVVGAPSDDDGGTGSGSAYVFVRSSGVWSQQAKLVADDASPGDHFGRAVAVSADTIVVGARTDDAPSTESGSAYIFFRVGNTWTQQAKLVASDAAAFDHFGGSVALSGDTAIVGATGDDDGGSFAGSAYVFVQNGAVWTQQAKLVSSAPRADTLFGASVSIDGDRASWARITMRRS